MAVVEKERSARGAYSQGRSSRGDIEQAGHDMAEALTNPTIQGKDGLTYTTIGVVGALAGVGLAIAFLDYMDDGEINGSVFQPHYADGSEDKSSDPVNPDGLTRRDYLRVKFADKDAVRSYGIGNSSSGTGCNISIENDTTHITCEEDGKIVVNDKVAWKSKEDDHPQKLEHKEGELLPKYLQDNHVDSGDLGAVAIDLYRAVNGTVLKMKSLVGSINGYENMTESQMNEVKTNAGEVWGYMNNLVKVGDIIREELGDIEAFEFTSKKYLAEHGDERGVNVTNGKIHEALVDILNGISDADTPETNRSIHSPLYQVFERKIGMMRDYFDDFASGNLNKSRRSMFESIVYGGIIPCEAHDFGGAEPQEHVRVFRQHLWDIQNADNETTIRKNSDEIDRLLKTDLTSCSN